MPPRSTWKEPKGLSDKEEFWNDQLSLTVLTFTAQLLYTPGEIPRSLCELPHSSCYPYEVDIIFISTLQIKL